MAETRLATLGVIVDPSGAVAGTLVVDAALTKTAATSKATTSAMKIQWASVRGIMLGVGSAIAGIGAGFSAVSALAEFAKFEQGMRNVAAVSVSTEAELKKLEETALEMAIATRYNPKQTTEALYALASAGLTATESIDTLPNVLNLAEAGQADLGKATELVVSTMAQFGIAAKDSQRVVDVLTAAIGDSAANVHRLQVGMAAAGPASNALGQSFEETVAAVSILTTALGNGEMAGTGVKTILGQLAAESKEMGLDVWDSATKMKPLADIMDQIRAKGIDIETIWKRLGLRGGPAMSALLEVGSEGLRKQTEAIRANGQAAEIAARQLDTLQGDLDQLGSSADVLQVRIGALLEGRAREAVQWMIQFVRGLTADIPAVVDEIEEWRRAWGPLTEAMIGEGTIVAKVFEGLGYIIQGVGWALKELYTVIKEFPINAVTAFQLIAASISDIWDSISTFNTIARESWAGIWDALPFAVEEAGLNAKIKWAEFLNDIKVSTGEMLLEIGEAIQGKFIIGEFAPEVNTAGFKLAGSKANTEEERKALEELNKEKLKTIKIHEDIIEAEKEARAERKKAHLQHIDEILEEHEVMMRGLKQNLDGITESTDVVQDTVREAMEEIEVLGQYRNTHTLQAAKNIADWWREAIDAIIDKIKEMERIWNGIINSMKAGNILPLLGNALDVTIHTAAKEGLAEGLKDGWMIFKQAIKEDPFAFGSSAVNFLGNIKDAFDRNDSGLRAVAEVASTIPGIVGDIANIVIGLDDLIFGGKLLGTNYQKVESGINVGFQGASGFTGTQFLKEERERSLFRGTKTRISESELDSQISNMLEKAFDAILMAFEGASRTLAVTTANIVTGSFEQIFDADGNVTRSISTVLGKVYNESIEDFTNRLIAENILAVIAETAADVQVPRLIDVFDQIGRGGIEDRDFQDLFAPGAGGVVETTVTMNEVHAIADRWRHDADLLLEGAQFLLHAQKDLIDGYDLMGGTLTQITDLVEDLNYAGEELAATYLRIKADTELLRGALRLTGVDLDLIGEEFVRFAVKIEESVGGLERATQLWGSFFENYFTDSERMVASLSQVRQEIDELQESLGTDLSFDTFRQAFEAALPTLSPEEIGQWLELGDAFVRVREIIGTESDPSSLVGAIAAYTNNAEGAAISSTELADEMVRTQLELMNMIVAMREGTATQSDFIAALEARRDAELAFLNAIEIAAERVSGIIGNAIERINLATMTDEQQYEYLTAKAEELAATIGNLTDPEEIAAVVAEIDRLQAQAFGLLDPVAQERLAQGFIDFLTDVQLLAETRLEELKTQTEQEQVDNNARLALVLEKFGEEAGRNSERVASAATTMNSAAETFSDAVRAFARTPIDVHVTVEVEQPDVADGLGGI